jgi:hypothetical protein
MRLIGFSQDPEQMPRSILIFLSYRFQHGLEEIPHERNALVSPCRVEQSQRARIDEDAYVPADVDIDKIEGRLRPT